MKKRFFHTAKNAIEAYGMQIGVQLARLSYHLNKTGQIGWKAFIVDTKGVVHLY